MPMDVTLAGMVMDVRPESRKAYEPMLVTLLGMVVPLHPTTNVFRFLSIIALQLSRESYFVFPLATLMVDNFVQPAKGLLPMVDTLLPMLTVVRLVQPSKAPLPIIITLISIDVRPV